MMSNSFILTSFCIRLVFKSTKYFDFIGQFHENCWFVEYTVVNEKMKLSGQSECNHSNWNDFIVLHFFYDGSVLSLCCDFIEAIKINCAGYTNESYEQKWKKKQNI